MAATAFDVFVVNNRESNRFELWERAPEGNRMVSFLDYESQENRFVIPWVETDPVRRGEGFADLLIAEVLNQIDRENSLVVPLCPIAAKHIADRPERHHLLAPVED